MKRCPECRKDYLDETLLYCLDDGTPLVQGSVSDEPKTAILSADRVVDEDVTALLKGDRTVAHSGPVTIQLPGFLSWERLPWLLAGLLLLAVVVLAVGSFRSDRPSGSAESIRAAFTIQPPGRFSGNGQISISPDGRQIAMLVTVDAANIIWLRPTDSIEGRLVPGTEGAQGFPFWSPDSRSLGFQASGKLKRIDLVDGTVRELADLPSDVRGFDGTWNRDGTIVYFQGGSGLYQIASSGGKPKPVPGYEQRNDGVDRWPRFLPDGRSFIFLNTSADQARSEVYVGSIDKPERKFLFEADSNAIYSPSPDGNSGYILFARGGSLLAQGFEPTSQQLIGEPFRVADRIRINFNSRAFFSVSGNGNLVFDPSTENEDARQVIWYDRAGKALEPIGQPGPIINIELSPDERFIAIARRPIGSTLNELVIFDTLRGTTSRLGTSPGETPQAIWSPDSKFVVWNDFSDGKFRLVKKLASGVGELEVLLESPVRVFPSSWSPDGRAVLYNLLDNVDKRDICVLPLDGERKPYVFIKSPMEDRDPFFSPDGKYIVYTSGESGKDEIYVQPFPASADKWLVSTNGGFSPRWSQKGNELVYVQPDGKVMSVSVKAGGTFEAGVPQVLFDVILARAPRGDDYIVSKDGQRLMFISRGTDGSLPPIHVILNWSVGLGK